MNARISLPPSCPKKPLLDSLDKELAEKQCRWLKIFGPIPLISLLLLLLLPLPALLFPSTVQASDLNVVKLDSPRDTMRTFMTAMNDYRRGVEINDNRLKSRIFDAVRCLNLSETPFVLQREKGSEFAIFLKEFIDRVIVINYELIPADPGSPENPLLRWRLKNTEVSIVLVQSGDRAGEYLFSADTVYRARDFFESVKHLPYLPGSGQGAMYKAPWLTQVIPTWASRPFLGLPVWHWLAILLSVAIGLTLKTLTQFVIQFLGRFSTTAPAETWRYWKFRALMGAEHPLGLMVATTFWFFTLFTLSFEGQALLILTTVNQIIFSISAIWLLYRLADVLSAYLKLVAEKTTSTLDDQLVPLLTKSLKVFVVIFGVLITFQNLGFNVMSILAGLGLGGLAFALAAKDTAANLFGSIMIFLDRPFRVGDWIITGKDEGMVEEIGFRSTRLRTFYNSIISIPNSVLANQTIDNMGMRQHRRLRAYFSITYDTSPEKIEAFLEGIKNIVRANPVTVKDNFHVVLDSFGSSDLRVMLYCFLDVPNWAQEMIARQNIYLEVLRLASHLDVRFAFPTSTLHVESLPNQPGVPASTLSPEELKGIPKEFSLDGRLTKATGQGFFTPPYIDS
jgi:MscS family membrane protein